MSERISVLAVGAGPLRSLSRRLGEEGDLEIAVAPALPSELSPYRVILAAGPQRSLGPQAAERLAGFVDAGGGLVTLGPALAAWAREPALRGLAGDLADQLGPLTELVVRPVAGHPVTERLDGELRITDRVHLDLRPPAGSTVLLNLSWHFSERPIAFVRESGRGRHLHFELGGAPPALATTLMRQVAHRAVRHAARTPVAGPIGVGMIGYGAIGREHAGSLREVAGLDLRAVCDRSPERLREADADFGVETTADSGRLLDHPGIDLVVVGVPPILHAETVLAALAAGKHVVCEKPFALTTAETDRMMEAAERAGRVLTVYQSRRWDPDFIAMRTAVAAGEIGDPFYMESFIGGYSHPCAYWHSHEPISGGTIYDWGSHYFDWVLLMIPSPVTRVAALAHKRVWHDVTNSDQVRVDLTFAGGAQATFLQSDIAAALKPKWYLLGTRGAVVGDWRRESVTSRAWTGDLVEEPLHPAESPALVRVFRPDGEGGSHEELLTLPRRVRNGFYRNLADHLLEGEPLAVPPAQARRTVAVMEAARASVASGGRPVRVRI